ncbi:MAG: type II secretion system protein [Desulfurivibrio sp.]|nr:type II secretion system protein [Desulfurivibrio sp.]
MTRTQAGFTLLEVIITLVVFAILGAMIVNFMTSSLVKSHQPVKMAQQLGTIQQCLECVQLEYNKHLYDGNTIWDDFVAQLQDVDCDDDGNVDCNVDCEDIKGQVGLSDAFEIYECTFGANGQSVNILFSEIAE